MFLFLGCCMMDSLSEFADYVEAKDSRKQYGVNKMELNESHDTSLLLRIGCYPHARFLFSYTRIGMRGPITYFLTVCFLLFHNLLNKDIWYYKDQQNICE